MGKLQQSYKSRFNMLRLLTVSLSSCLFSVALAQKKIDVNITGIKGELLKNVQARLSLLTLDNNGKNSETRIRRLFKLGHDEIRIALQPYGYYHPTIKSDIESSENAWQIHYDISQGEPIIIQDVRIKLTGDGTTNTLMRDLFAKPPFKVGDVLIQPHYDDFKQDAYSLSQMHGFFDARFSEQVIAIDRQKNEAEIHLSFDSESQYHIGEIRYHSEHIRDTLLGRLSLIKPGQAYDSEKLAASRMTLNRYDYFKNIEMLLQPEDKAEKVIDIDVNLSDNPKFKYEFGLGYGTDTGYRSAVKWKLRRVNRYGHNLSNDYRYGQYKSSYGASYQIPGFHPITNQFVINTSYVRDRSPDRNNDLSTKKLGGSYLYNSLDTLRSQNISIDYQYEKYFDTQGKDSARLLLPSFTAEWIDTENRFSPEKGHRISVMLRGAADSVLSTTTFTQASIKGKKVYSFDDNYRLIGRGEFGASWVEDIHDVPPSLRFYAGGDHSVRGYGYQSLGPIATNESGNTFVLGGKYLIEGSMELERKLFGNFRGAIFYDVGNALDELKGKLMKGAGLGLRWQSPIGMVRIDVAHPFDDPGTNYHLHFNLGPDL